MSERDEEDCGGLLDEGEENVVALAALWDRSNVRVPVSELERVLLWAQRARLSESSLHLVLSGRATVRWSRRHGDVVLSPKEGLPWRSPPSAALYMCPSDHDGEYYGEVGELSDEQLAFVYREVTAEVARRNSEAQIGTEKPA